MSMQLALTGVSYLMKAGRLIGQSVKNSYPRLMCMQLALTDMCKLPHENRYEAN